MPVSRFGYHEPKGNLPLTENLDSVTVHASAVCIDNHGILIIGESGLGKSDLALRLIDRGAVLVSDDQVEMQRREDSLWLSPPPSIEGKLEVRSLGVVELSPVGDIELALTVDLKQSTERYPMDSQTKSWLGLDVPMINLDAKESSAPIKVELALQAVLQHGGLQ